MILYLLFIVIEKINKHFLNIIIFMFSALTVKKMMKEAENKDNISDMEQ